MGNTEGATWIIKHTHNIRVTPLDHIHMYER